LGRRPAVDWSHCSIAARPGAGMGVCIGTLCCGLVPTSRTFKIE
jgi:hypothetical protein